MLITPYVIVFGLFSDSVNPLISYILDLLYKVHATITNDCRFKAISIEQYLAPL